MRRPGSASDSRARLLLVLALAASMLAFAGCRRRATADECAQMLERYVDMTIETPAGTTLTDAQLAAVRDMKRAIRMSEPAYTKTKERCERELTSRTHACAMKAGNANEWEACVQE